MDATPQQPKERDGVISSLNLTIEVVNLAKEVASIPPAKIVFGAVSILLAMIRDSMASRSDCVELGLACADVCKALDRGMKGRHANEFNRSVFEAIEQLTTTVTEIQRNISKIGKRGGISRVFHAKNDGDTIAAWRSKLRDILQVFDTELAINTHVAVSDTQVAVLNTQTVASEIQRTLMEHVVEGRKPSTRTGVPGESPPPPPRAFFGRAEIVEKLISLAEGLTPMALIGPGGIGKTSVSLAVLHDNRIKKRFGDHRRFIRCDQFPASCAHFLARLSKAIGARIENPEDLTPLRPSLSSNEMLIVLDNAESILDPQGDNGQEIYRLVEELSQFPNICLAITSRITTIPPNCETLKVQTLSTEAAHDTFYNIYKHGGRSESINAILKQLDFHPLSVTLLATVAHQNMWDNNRLAREWEEHQTGVLQTEHRTSLAATIELSLASPMFRELGPDARGVLGVVAFYPQGINEKYIDWLLPTISNGTRIFDKFCILSLTYRSNGFITMLAPLRDHLRPRDPKTSPLLCTTKERYCAPMCFKLTAGRPPEFADARWILSEDANVEHLLDVFTTIDPDSNDIWDACIGFIAHLYWHKPRQTELRRKIGGLPDNHRSKPRGLLILGSLSGLIGNHIEGIRFLTHALKLGRERRDDHVVAEALRDLSLVNRLLGHCKEGILQAREALEVYRQLGEAVKCAECLIDIARLLQVDGQLDAAEEATVESIKLLPEQGQEHMICESHFTLGGIYRSKGERGKAIYEYEAALGIAATLKGHHFLFWVNFASAETFLDEDGFDKAHAHVERAKTYAHHNPFHLGLAVLLQAQIWCQQRRFEEAASEALRGQEIFKELGNSQFLEKCKTLLQQVEEAMENPPASRGSNSNARGTSSSTSTA